MLHGESSVVRADSWWRPNCGMKTHWAIHHCDASAEKTIKDSYIRIYVCNLTEDKGLPCSFLNTIYTEADVMALKNVVGGIGHDTLHLLLLYLHEYIFKLCAFQVAAYAYKCLFIGSLFWWTTLIDTYLPFFNLLSSPKPPLKRLSAILGRCGLLASCGRRGSGPQSLSRSLLPLQKQHRWLKDHMVKEGASRVLRLR